MQSVHTEAKSPGRTKWVTVLLTFLLMFTATSCDEGVTSKAARTIGGRDNIIGQIQYLPTKSSTALTAAKYGEAVTVLQPDGTASNFYEADGVKFMYLADEDINMGDTVNICFYHKFRRTTEGYWTELTIDKILRVGISKSHIDVNTLMKDLGEDIK